MYGRTKSWPDGCTSAELTSSGPAENGFHSFRYRAIAESPSSALAGRGDTQRSDPIAAEAAAKRFLRNTHADVLSGIEHR